MPTSEHRTSFVLYRCQRCGGLHSEPHPDANVALRRAVEAGQLATIHTCFDGALGCCRLIGTGPGAPKAPEKPAEEVTPQ